MQRIPLAWLVLGLIFGCQPEPPPFVVPLDELNWTLSSPGHLEHALGAQVPGHVLPDLVRAGLAPHPYQDTNEREVQWVEEWPWVYSTTLALPQRWADDSKVQLAFDGLDTYAHIRINGKELLATDNAHRTWITPPFELSTEGARLEVAFDPVAKRGQEELDAHGLVVPAGNESRPIGQQTSPFTRKAGYQFGWDWGPRLAGPGIVGSITLHRVIEGVGLPSTIAPSCSVMEVSAERARISVHGREDWELSVLFEGQHISCSWEADTLVMHQPELWWPVHMGDQPLYNFHWTHVPTGQTHEHKFGIRTAKWVEQEDAWGTSFQLYINGVPVQARGSNVIPPDFHDAYDCDGWQTLISHALRANMNMVRVWGGGVYPPDCFFEACDRQGLLVWQDFMFACSMVPDDDAFASNVDKEARQHAFRLRHHPSLALWCGNNEVLRAWHQWGWQDLYNLHGADSVRLALAYDRIFHDVLPRSVSENCDVHYHPTSPTLDSQSGDEHAWNIWFGLEEFDYYSRNAGRFVSEFGLQSLPDRHTLREAGITSFDDDALQYRQRSKMEWLEPGFDGWDMMLHFMSKTTGAPAPLDLDDWIFRSQATQAEGLREALERHRTSQGRYSGSLYWSLNDIWPAVSWSTVDHAGRWKLGHYAARRANKSLTAQWQRERKDSLTLVVFNDGGSAFQGSLVAEVCAMNGTVLNRESTSLQLYPHDEFDWQAAVLKAWATTPEATYLAWSLLDEKGNIVERSTALWMAAIDSDLEPCEVKCDRTESGWTLTASSYTPVAYLTSSVPGHFSDNGMALEAGKPVEVRFSPETVTEDLVDIQARVLNP